jgi:hypothetical protein
LSWVHWSTNDERFGEFGRLLKCELPLSSVDAPASSAGTPVVLASELLSYEGDLRSFADALATTAGGGSREQLYNVVAVTQASGSGRRSWPMRQVWTLHL